LTTTPSRLWKHQVAIGPTILGHALGDAAVLAHAKQSGADTVIADGAGRVQPEVSPQPGISGSEERLAAVRFDDDGTIQQPLGLKLAAKLDPRLTGPKALASGLNGARRQLEPARRAASGRRASPEARTSGRPTMRSAVRIPIKATARADE
jgi:hypothetical protein